MKLTAKLVAVLLLVVGVSEAAMAAEGAFALASLGQSSYASGSSPLAIRAGGGYNFVELKNIGLTIGAEGALASFGSSSNSVINGKLTTKTTGLLVSAVASWDVPHVNGLSVIGKLGVMHAKTDGTIIFFNNTGVTSSGTSNGIFVGAGVQYNLTKNWAVRGLYEDFGNAVVAPTGSFYGSASYGLTMISAGVVYNF